MGIGLLNYVAAGAGQAMGRAADAGYAHWTEKDLQDQKDQAEAKKEQRIIDQTLASRDEAEQHARSPQVKEDTANTVREGAINTANAEIESNRLKLQEATNPNTVRLTNQLKKEDATGTTEAEVASKDIKTQHEQNPDVIKAQAEADLLKEQEKLRNEAKVEPTRLLSPVQARADAAAQAASRKATVEIWKLKSESEKNMLEGAKYSADAKRQIQEADTKNIEAAIKGLEAMQKAIDSAETDEAKTAAKIMYKKGVADYDYAKNVAYQHTRQLFGEPEPTVADMPPAEQETSTAPGGGSAPVEKAPPAKPTGAINSLEPATEKAPTATEKAPAKPTGAINSLEPATGKRINIYDMNQTQIMLALANSDKLNPEQKAYLEKNSLFHRFKKTDPEMAQSIFDSAGVVDIKPAAPTNHFETAKRQHMKTLTPQQQTQFIRATRQQQEKTLKDAGYST